MGSGTAPGHSEEIMVAQPVDTITPPAHASVRDIMSPALGSVAKETRHTDISADAKSDASFSYSEDSPEKKEKKDESKKHKSKSKK